MTNKNDPAFPMKGWDGSLSDALRPMGLTKREWFAGMAMMGLRAQKLLNPSEEIASLAIRDADALIAKLSKEVKA